MPREPFSPEACASVRRMVEQVHQSIYGEKRPAATHSITSLEKVENADKAAVYRDAPPSK
jgi:hypothetical protein